MMYDLTIPDWTVYMPAAVSPSRKICVPRLKTRLGNDEGPGETSSAANHGVIRQRIRAVQSWQSDGNAGTSVAGWSAWSSRNDGRADPAWYPVIVPLGVSGDVLPVVGTGIAPVLVRGLRFVS
jgi:hypothetical protein